MGETINQIERDLAAERADLGRNLDALQTKARELTDWKHYYRNHPGQVLAVALAGGVVLGIMAGGKSAPGRRTLASSPNPAEPHPRNRALDRLEQDWHHISDALMGVASAKVMEFVGNLVPGFRDQLRGGPTSSL